MELRDILTRDGVFTGKVIEKHEPTGAGEYLYHACIILKNADGQYVLQQRALKAKYFPGKWDVTGGGVMHGESAAEAAAREAREELGIPVDAGDCVFVGRQTEDWDGGGGLIMDVFGVRVDVAPEELTIERREVEAVRLAPFSEFVETVLYNKDDNFRAMLEKVERLV